MFSFATGLVWVGASLFLSQQHTGISTELQQLARPLNPNIHIEVVDQIQQKRTFSSEELQGFSILRLVHNTNGTDTLTTTSQVNQPAAPAATQSGTPATPTTIPAATPTTQTTP